MTRPWTLLAYVVADDKGGADSLDAAAHEEIGTICQAADLRHLNVAIQVDYKRRNGVYRATVKSVRAFDEVNPRASALWRDIERQVGQSELRVQHERQDLNAAAGGVLDEFLAYGREACAADHYAIFFYGHASGPMGLFYDTAPGTRSPTMLRLNDLATSLGHSGSRAEVVLFRDCFMNTLETACQLQGVAHHIIATQAEAPIAGQWPWQDLLASLSGDGPEAAVSMARRMAAHFEVAENRGPFPDVPCSLIAIDAVPEATAALSALVQGLTRARGDVTLCRGCAGALEGARRGSPATPDDPGDPALLDLLTACENLAAIDDADVAPAARALADVVRGRLVRFHSSQRDVFRGISIYYKPLTDVDRDRSYIQAASEVDVDADEAYYATLALSRATGWHDIAVRPLDPEFNNVR